MSDQGAIARFQIHQQMVKHIGQATDNGRDDIFKKLTKLAQAVIEARDDAATLTQDNKERMVRRLFYLIEPSFLNFVNQLYEPFVSLWTEEPPQVTP